MIRPLLIPAKSYPNNFDFVRLILAVSVIFCHCFAIFYGYEKFLHTEPFMVWSNQQISIGSVAVDLFFIISGFLIVKSFENSENTIEYFKKRILRIYPGFTVAFLFSIFLIGFFGSGMVYNLQGYHNYFSNLYKKQELVHLITLQGPYQRMFFKDAPEPGVNDSLWTIQFEFICYLLVPLWAGLNLFRNKWFFMGAFMMAFIVYYLQLKGFILPYKNSTNLFVGNAYNLPRFIMYFLSGALFYVYKNVIIRSNLLAIAAVFSLVLSFIWLKHIDQILPLAGGYLIFYIVFNPAIKTGNFAKYGDLSYGIYLYGWPVQAAVMYFLKDSINPYSFFLIAVAIAAILAFLSWHIIEKPFLKLKEKKRILNLAVV